MKDEGMAGVRLEDFIIGVAIAIGIGIECL